MLDCPTCLLEIPYWNSIFCDYPDTLVNVIGIANSLSRNSLLSFIKRKNIKFPIIFDYNDDLKKICNIKKTPLRIILNRDYELIDFEKPTEKSFANKSLIKKIKFLSENYYQIKS
jgi:peroxiredoxin